MILIYRLICLLIFPFFMLFGILFSKKTRHYLFNRKTNLVKNTNIQTIWIHTSSGEFEHAKFLIRSLKKQYPLEKIIVSYSSPSYFNTLKNFNLIDGYIPMPVDLKAPIASLIKRINPKIILFSRTDLWPELIYQIKAKNIPSIVFAKMENSKSCFGEKLLFSLTYKKIDHISFVSENDKELFIKKFNHNYNLSVDGDPRIDEIVNRVKNLNFKPKKEGRTLILGSVLNKDLKQISHGVIKALNKKTLNKVIAVPHDPTKKNIKELQNIFKSFSPSLYSLDPDLENKVIIVDSTGLLFNLYAQSDLAFVGGAFKKKVHSVIEPLSHGLPVLVGPYINNNTEAKYYSKKHSFVKVCKNKIDFSKKLSNLLLLDQEGLSNLKILIQARLLKSTGATNKIINHIKEKIKLHSYS